MRSLFSRRERGATGLPGVYQWCGPGTPGFPRIPVSLVASSFVESRPRATSWCARVTGASSGSGFGEAVPRSLVAERRACPDPPAGAGCGGMRAAGLFRPRRGVARCCWAVGVSCRLPWRSFVPLNVAIVSNRVAPYLVVLSWVRSGYVVLLFSYAMLCQVMLCSVMLG